MIKCNFENGNEALLRHVVLDALVIKSDEILLVKRAPQLVEGKKWGLVGGYMNRGETLEQTLAREVLEETGYQISDVTLLSINARPDRQRDERQNVAFVYFCKALTKTGEPDNESTEQRWFPLSQLPADSEIAFDHLSFINLYKAYQRKPFALPNVQ